MSSFDSRDPIVCQTIWWATVQWPASEIEKIKADALNITSWWIRTSEKEEK